MAGGWPRLTKTPEGHQQKSSTTMTAEEQRAYDAAVAKASSWLSAAEEEMQQQPPLQSLHVQDARAQQYPQMEPPADEYALRLEQLRMAAAPANPAAAAPAADQQGRPVAGLQALRQPSWGNDPSTSQQSSPQASRAAMSPALQWGATSSKSPPLGPKGYGTSPCQRAALPFWNNAPAAGREVTTGKLTIVRDTWHLLVSTLVCLAKYSWLVNAPMKRRASAFNLRN